MDIIFKITGCTMVFLASTLFGVYMSKREFLRIKEMQEMKRALTMLKSEITFLLCPFSEAAVSISEKIKSPVKELFYETGVISLEKTHESITDIWDEVFEKHAGNTSFTKEDKEAFSGFAKSIGYMDREMQSASIDIVIGYIDDKTSELTKKSEKTMPMYRSLGVLGGILIVITLF